MKKSVKLNNNDLDVALELSKKIVFLFDNQPVRVALVALESALGAVICTSTSKESDKEQAKEIIQAIADNIKEKL